MLPMTSQSARPDEAARAPFVTTTDGVQLFYRDWGDGKPIVFLSGWALPSDMWAYQMAPLSEAGFRCVAYDRRGHGRSTDPGRGYDYDRLADDLAAVLAALGLEDVTLVGHSMACGEIVRYLSRHGDRRVARIVFLATAATPFPLKTSDNPDGLDERLFEQVRSRIAHDFPGWLDDNAGPYFLPETSPGLYDWTKRTMLQTSLLAALECNRTLSTTDFRPELPSIRVPTLLIHGTVDASAPLDLTGRPTARMIPGAILKVYEGAPHGLYITHQDALNRDLRAFVAGQAG